MKYEIYEKRERGWRRKREKQRKREREREIGISFFVSTVSVESVFCYLTQL
jgi:hypothetical protein